MGLHTRSFNCGFPTDPSTNEQRELYNFILFFIFLKKKSNIYILKRLAEQIIDTSTRLVNRLYTHTVYRAVYNYFS